MDKLRACIVANYYANAGQPKVQEVLQPKHSHMRHHIYITFALIHLVDNFIFIFRE